MSFVKCSTRKRFLNLLFSQKVKAKFPLLIVMATLFFLTSCVDDSPVPISYSKGDLWVANFRSSGFPSKAFKDDKIYCSSLLIDDTTNFLYCLDLVTGKVEWAAPVKSWATSAPIVQDSFIYYSSYVGDLYKFDRKGQQLWYTQLHGSFGDHCINPINQNLIVELIYGGQREFDKHTGEVINAMGIGQYNMPLPTFQHDTAFYKDGNLLYARKVGDSSNIWSNSTGENINRLFIDQGLLFYFDESRRLYCLEAATGKLIWKSDTIFPMQPTLPSLEFLAGKIVTYFPGDLHCYVLDFGTGKVLQRLKYDDVYKGQYLAPVSRKYIITNSSRQYSVNVQKILFEEDFDITVEVMK